MGDSPSVTPQSCQSRKSCLPFAICHLPFAICHLPSAICHLVFPPSTHPFRLRHRNRLKLPTATRLHHSDQQRWNAGRGGVPTLGVDPKPINSERVASIPPHVTASAWVAAIPVWPLAISDWRLPSRAPQARHICRNRPPHRTPKLR